MTDITQASDAASAARPRTASPEATEVPETSYASHAVGFLTVAATLSLALGPLVGGLVSDKVFGGEALGGSLSLMAAVNCPLAAIALLFCLRP